jgi:hypothetical protein
VLVERDIDAPPTQPAPQLLGEQALAGPDRSADGFLVDDPAVEARERAGGDDVERTGDVERAADAAGRRATTSNPERR